MMFKNSILLHRIFSVFDSDKDGTIDFNEFIRCLSTMSSKATPEEKLKCNIHVSLHLQFSFIHALSVSFDVYDANGDGVISSLELKDTLQALMSEQGITMTSSEAEELVRQTMLSCSSSESKEIITFEE